MILDIILWCVLCAFGVFLVLASVYESTGFGKCLFDKILGWHEPVDKIEFNGMSYCSRCKYCGKQIMQDSQGNWFEVDGE